MTIKRVLDFTVLNVLKLQVGIQIDININIRNEKFSKGCGFKGIKKEKKIYVIRFPTLLPF